MHLAMIPTMTCTVCGQLIDLDRQEIDSSAAVLFGAARYAWCVECRQEVHRPWTADYKRAWIRASRSVHPVPKGTIGRLRAAWREGAFAERQRQPLSGNPHPCGDERVAWTRGYECARAGGTESDRGFRRWVCSNTPAAARLPRTTG